MKSTAPGISAASLIQIGGKKRGFGCVVKKPLVPGSRYPSSVVQRTPSCRGPFTSGKAYPQQRGWHGPSKSSPKGFPDPAPEHWRWWNRSSVLQGTESNWSLQGRCLGIPSLPNCIVIHEFSTLQHGVTSWGFLLPRFTDGGEQRGIVGTLGWGISSTLPLLLSPCPSTTTCTSFSISFYLSFLLLSHCLLQY